jgi:hypothetical protein
VFAPDGNDNGAFVAKAVMNSFDVTTVLGVDGVEIGVVDVVWFNDCREVFEVPGYRLKTVDKGLIGEEVDETGNVLVDK